MLVKPDVAIFDQLVLAYPMPNRLNSNHFVEALKADEYEDRWVLFKELRYAVNGEMRIVPAKFQTDLASIPRLVTNIIPRYGLHLAASAIHDWHYYMKIMTQEWADDVFLAMMLMDEVPERRASIMHAAVEAFGRRAWLDDD